MQVGYDGAACLSRESSQQNSDVESHRESLTTAVVATGTDEAITDALAELTENDRELVTLILWDGFGVAEAGAVLGLKPATPRTRFARAKARLRDLHG